MLVRKKNKGKYDKDPTDWLHPRKPLAREEIKTGKEVGLTSPNSEQLVALGTVQKICNNDYVEVLVNMVLKSTTQLPHPKGRMTIISHAEARRIRWPQRNVSPTYLHQKGMYVLLYNLLNCDAENCRSQSQI